MEKPCSFCGKIYDSKYPQEAHCSSECRFYQKVEKTDECWNWIAGHDYEGYGQFSVGEKNYRAHRYVWISSNGEIPKKQSVYHTCNNVLCVKIEHLYLGPKNTKKQIYKEIVRPQKEKKVTVKKPQGEVYLHERKLTRRDIVYIRADTRNYREIMRDYKITKEVYRKLLVGEYWRHV